MAYLFDDYAATNRLTRAVIDPYSGSVWFYPDDSGLDCVIWSQYNAAASRYWKVQIEGSTSDKVTFETFSGSSVGIITSVGTVNYNAWNHVYFARGANTGPTAAHISLNGESLVSGGAGTFVAPGTVTAQALGRIGATSPTLHYSGYIAEVSFWDNALHEFGDHYQSLAMGFDPRLIPVDPNGTAGLTPLNLIRYSTLHGNPLDIVLGTSWTVVGATVAMTHPSIRRNFVGG